MTKKKSSKMTILSKRHRAVCDDDSFKGPWQTELSDARADARAHRNAKPDNQDHVIRVVTEQTASKLF